MMTSSQKCGHFPHVRWCVLRNINADCGGKVGDGFPQTAVTIPCTILLRVALQTPIYCPSTFPYEARTQTRFNSSNRLSRRRDCRVHHKSQGYSPGKPTCNTLNLSVFCLVEHRCHTLLERSWSERERSIKETT